MCIYRDILITGKNLKSGFLHVSVKWIPQNTSILARTWDLINTHSLIVISSTRKQENSKSNSQNMECSILHRGNAPADCTCNGMLALPVKAFFPLHILWSLMLEGRNWSSRQGRKSENGTCCIYNRMEPRTSLFTRITSSGWSRGDFLFLFKK